MLSSIPSRFGRALRFAPIVAVIAITTGCNVNGQSLPATNVGETTATLNATGTVTAGTTGAAVYFKYSENLGTTAVPVWKDTTHIRKNAGATGNHLANLIMLSPSTRYVFKACARDLVQSAASTSLVESTTENCAAQQSFTTLASAPITPNSFSQTTPTPGAILSYAQFAVNTYVSTSRTLVKAEVALGDSPVLRWTQTTLSRNTLRTGYWLRGYVSPTPGTTLTPNKYTIYVRLYEAPGPTYTNALSYFYYNPLTAVPLV